jgi:hypothetical protein
MADYDYDVVVTGVVEPGLGYASGLRSTKYPEGTIYRVHSGHPVYSRVD